MAFSEEESAYLRSHRTGHLTTTAADGQPDVGDAWYEARRAVQRTGSAG
ncbi:MAG: hypothetical protein J2P24_03005 [Streptosporangiales bacterium]|nr:hypothetical protein [Streptosporangiales bacterium]MBO0890996.1 hypothetical protein [Acidothermales bacterium]